MPGAKVVRVPAESDVHHVQNVVGAALTATAGQSEAVKAAASGGAAAAAAGAIGTPNTRTTDILWIIVVYILGLVTLGSAISIGVYAFEHKASRPDVLVTVFTAALSGLIGLFVRPPSSL